MRPPRARVLLRAVLPITATAALVLIASGPAGAAIGPVHASPSSGPPGTAFTVSGSGCGPGLTVSGSDYVSVSSTSLPLDVHVPVNRAGSWSTTFNVPTGALPIPALIAATCVTDGILSFTTFYTPATFVVTAASPTTVPPPPPPPTSPTTSGSTGTTATTKGRTTGTKGGKGSGTGHGTSTGAGSGSESGSGSGSGRSGHAGASSGRGGAGGTATAGGAADGSAAKRSGTVAGLRSPELASDSQRASSGINPWWWALLALLGAGAIGAWLWLRHRATPTDAPGAPEPGTADDPGSGEADTADPGDDLDDDWPAFPVLDEEPTITR